MSLPFHIELAKLIKLDKLKETSVTMSAADRATAVIFFALGIAMLIGGFTMERLEFRQIHPLSIPGLVPMLLGGALAFCAVILLVQSRQDGETENLASGSFVRLGQTVALTLGYALILVGWLPFYWATAIFVAAFTLVFSWDGAMDQRTRVLTVLKSIIYGGVAGFAIVMLFEKAFLVRLP